VCRQKFPNGGIFGAQNPGAEALQAAFFGEVVALAEGARVGVENPFAFVVAVEIEPRVAIGGVPFDVAAVGAGQVECVGRGNVGGGRIRPIGGFRVGRQRRGGEPVVAIKRDAERNFLARDEF